jgi:flagellar motor protein MotB
MKKGEASDHGFLSSQADLMAGVAGIFFVLLAILLIDAETRAAKAEAEKTKVETMEVKRGSAREYVLSRLEEIREHLISQESAPVEATLVDDVLEVDIDPPPRDVFVFDVNSDRLAPSKQVRALDVLRSVLTTICAVIDNVDRGPNAIERIVLEGHTDNLGFGVADCRAIDSDPKDCFGENVGLSGRRAVNILRLVYEDARTPIALRRCVEKSFLITGRGPVSPLGGGDWRAAQAPEQREVNRRVVLRVEGRRDLDHVVQEREKNRGVP